VGTGAGAEADEDARRRRSGVLLAPSLWVQASSPLMHAVFDEIVSDPWVRARMKVREDTTRQEEAAQDRTKRMRALLEEQRQLRLLKKDLQA